MTVVVHVCLSVCKYEYAVVVYVCAKGLSVCVCE